MSGICNILGVPFNNMSSAEAVEMALVCLGANHKSILFTPNPEMVMLAQKDPEFMEVLNKSDINVPDGIGIVYGSKFTDNPIEERVAGYDLVQAVFERIKTTRRTVYFFGGAPGVAQQAKEAMEKKHRGINIIGVADGYFDEEKEKQIIDEINQLHPDLLLVGIGFPKQEKWIYNNLNKLDIRLAIGVGGSFDVMSGNVKRAPQAFRKLGLEWFYRLITQPTRIGRMLQLPVFMFAVIKDKLTVKKKPRKPRETVKIKDYTVKIKHKVKKKPSQPKAEETSQEENI